MAKLTLQRTRLGRTALQVCRMGLGGGYGLPTEAVRRAIALGVDYLWADVKWPEMARAVQGLSPSQRQRVVVAAGGDGRRGEEVQQDLDRQLEGLGTDYLDLFLFHYIQTEEEFQRTTASGGGLEALHRAREQGKVRYFGASTHNRPLAAQMAASGLLDVLVVRYNCAHTGAEQEVFPVTQQSGVGLVVYTPLRWGSF